ncbi:hypothetical protein HBH70_067080 [Parastagonospora nodorum]|nr:hypothetical protein HBH50_074560 [Parastagonospora nodorum]KAH4095134.1 hypothetical protein HBH48_062820 [Parastagonospora nodorum]KAH4856428.1 hypothetical protein HBH75_073190 [Parastagonospora nodorum]KAH5144222.1 hypothetical protein HBH70_067080 [Parastagonospora nodorum]
MEQLPQELADQICRYLTVDDLYTVSLLSREFRKAAKDCARKYPREIVEYQERDKQAILKRYSGFLHHYIERIKFDLWTPDPKEPDVDSWCNDVDPEEQRERDIIFTAQIRDLFETLKTLEERACEEGHGAYELVICVPDAFSKRDSQNYCICADHAKWRTKLLDPEKLPGLLSVRALRIRDPDEESFIKLDYRIITDLIAHLPNVESAVCYIGADESTPLYVHEPAKSFVWEFDNLRRDTRHGLLEAIESLTLPESLRSVHLDFFPGSYSTEGNLHHYKAQPDFVTPATTDPFSNSLRILSRNLRHLTLSAQIDSSMFVLEDGSVPIWPNLEELRIKFYMVTPSGNWYFEGPRGEGRDLHGYDIVDALYPDDYLHDCDDDERGRSFESWGKYLFRISPNEQILRPFLASFAKALTNMPKLRHAVLWTPLDLDTDCYSDDDDSAFNYYNLPSSWVKGEMAWGLQYCAPGELGVVDQNPLRISECRQIQWNVGEWRPDTELHGMFQQIGREQHGEALKERWDDDKFGQGLVVRWDFEELTRDERLW